MSQSSLVQFSKPFLDALTDTFSKMLETEIKVHTPILKTERVANGDISAMIGMNGKRDHNGEQHDFRGLLVLSWYEPIYVKLASRMLMEEYEEYCDEISDFGAEIANIVMGNAKSGLNPLGYQIEMATPSTVSGKDHCIKYVNNSTIIGMTVSCDVGDFTLELCYIDNVSK